MDEGDKLFSCLIIGSFLLLYWGAILLKWIDVVIQLINQSYSEGLNTIIALVIGTIIILPLLICCIKNVIEIFSKDKR